VNLSAIFGRNKVRKARKESSRIPVGATEQETELILKYRAFTGAPPARMYALVNAINYVDANALPGDLVECGVFRGANPMLSLELRRSRPLQRLFYLYDTFAGMTAPTIHDIRQDGNDAASLLNSGDTGTLALCTIDDVKTNFASNGLSTENAVFVKGPVEETLRIHKNIPERIAVLRLDTDFYESTKVELEVLYPRLVSGGVLIIDDYGSWQGARRAVDEYFGARAPLLTAVDSECRVAIKPAGL
jgi:hypothetical protein